MYSNSFSRNATRHCPHCMKDHLPNQKCEIACAYCHSFHLRTDLIQGVCPNMLNFAQQQRPKHKLICKGCQGEGMLEKAIEVTFLQLENKWEKRVNLFKSYPENNGRDLPVRRVVRVQHKLETYQCKECEGTGIINKVSYCCRYGCEKCNSQRCFINPLWLKYKSDDYAATCNGIFSCSHCHKKIDIGGKYFSLPCDHLYHSQCFADNCWECLECEQAEEEKERMAAIKKMEEKLELEVSDIVSNEHQASDIDNLKEEITNLSFAPKKKSQERVFDPRSLYTYMLQDSYIPRIDLDDS